jgi:hypothetical protein
MEAEDKWKSNVEAKLYFQKIDQTGCREIEE